MDKKADNNIEATVMGVCIGDEKASGFKVLGLGLVVSVARLRPQGVGFMCWGPGLGGLRLKGLGA